MALIALIVAVLVFIDSISQTMLVEGQESHIPPERANKLIWRAIFAFVAMTIFGFASFAHGEELKEFAGAQTQTMKAAGPNWTKTEVFEKLGRKFVIPEEMAEIATYTGAEIKLLFDKLLAPAFYNYRGHKMIDALKAHGYGMVPVPPGLVATAPEVWLAVRMEAIQLSFNQDFVTQRALATDRYKRMPTAEEVVWFARVIWVTRNQLPFEHIYVRTSSPSLDGGHLCVGENEGGVLKVKACADDLKSPDIGVTAVAVR